MLMAHLPQILEILSLRHERLSLIRIFVVIVTVVRFRILACGLVPPLHLVVSFFTVFKVSSYI
jgi:hypothetical protein